MREHDDIVPLRLKIVIPEHILEFLRSTVPTIWALDLLRLLKSSPDRIWTVGALTSELRGSTSMVENNLKTFCAWGLAMEERPGSYRYAATELRDSLVVELLQIYRERPMAIIQEVAETPNERIRTFVDAFKLKGG